MMKSKNYLFSICALAKISSVVQARSFRKKKELFPCCSIKLERISTEVTKSFIKKISELSLTFVWRVTCFFHNVLTFTDIPNRPSLSSTVKSLESFF